MLAAPGMIGKSSAAAKLTQVKRDIKILNSDDLMHKMFGLVRIPDPVNVAINEEAAWLPRVNEHADANHLIRLLHRDYVSRFGDSRIVVAEGYVYMRQWYRQQVTNGLRQLPGSWDFRLLKYVPSIDVQTTRRAQRYVSLHFGAESAEFHRHELEKEWAKFDSCEGEEFSCEEVNDFNIAQAISRIESAFEK